MTEKDILLVISTAPDPATAERLARELIGKSLAACANIVPAVRSIYLWKGEVESEQEVLMLLKTTTDRLPELRETLVAAHPYELPEVIALPVTDGHHPYLQWVAAMSSPPLNP